ncbi:MAG: type III pantothenate kinase [Methylococcales bacterium]|nr:type III pantothenate kinase [Methylococcales bacterium]
MTTILVDIGNTRIKLCTVSHDGTFSQSQAIIHKNKDYLKDIQHVWSLLPSPSTIAISSVTATHILLEIVALVKKNWLNIKVVIAKSSSCFSKLTNAYPKPETLGVDRWLGLIALQHYYAGNSCIVDCGTAITIDCLNKNGQHLGGLISPGLGIMKQSLFKGTEGLVFAQQDATDIGLASSTESAIYTGILYAAAGLIEKALARLCVCDTLILTGGDAALLAKHLDLNLMIEPDFILKGLSLYCKKEK